MAGSETLWSSTPTVLDLHGLSPVLARILAMKSEAKCQAQSHLRRRSVIFPVHLLAVRSPSQDLHAALSACTLS